ncbi:MAG TPA: response regulator transcription factor [Solirubrobacteraceae bacterium]|nr:response regulator transcription factor [Solirubrobacteraceae bacterium]
MRVLVVEDHTDLASHIAEGLRDRGIAADTAADGAIALHKSLATPYDVILLDRDLPLVHGDTVCAKLRDNGAHARILMVTASATVADRVEGLNLGADDYLTKPFAFEELVARVRALARREPSTPPVLTRQGITVDRAHRTAIRDGRLLQLNRKEFGLLEMLISAGGTVVSQESLLQTVWDENTDPFTRTVTVTMARLRRKLGDPDPIETLIGAGYRMR